MSGGKGSNTTTTNTSPNPMAMGAYADVLARAQGVANLPYTPYGGELVAGINQQQNLGIGNINQNAGFAQPFIGQAAQYANNAAQPITAAQIQNYQNPYTQQVVNATEAQFQNQNAQQQSQLLGNAASQHALGGDRVGVAQANLAGQQALAQNPIIAGLYSQGYQNAEQMALAQQQAMAQGAYSLGNLGVAGQNAALQGAGAQFGVGSAQQQTQQAEDTARLQQFQQQQAFPYQQAQWLAGIDSGIGSQMGGQSQTIGPPPNPWAQLAGLGLAGAGLLAPSKQGATGGRIAGFADGGSPFGSAMPYGGVGGYIPTINLPIGNTMPKGGTGGNGAAAAPAFNPTAAIAAAKGVGSLRDRYIGNTNTDLAFGDNGDVISAGNYELGGASGGRVRGFADGGVPDDVYFNPTPMTGGLGSGSVIERDRYGSAVVDGTDLAPISEDRFGIAPGQSNNWDRGNNAALRADIPDEVRYGNSKGAGASPMPSSALGYDEVQPRAEEPTGGFAPRPGQAPQRGNVGLANAFGMSDAAKMGLLSAGFGMMASKSPFLGSAIGEGGLAGVQGYVGQKERERSEREKKSSIDLQVEKLQQAANQFNERQNLERDKFKEDQQQNAFTRSKPQTINDPILGPRTIIPDGKNGWKYVDTGEPVNPSSVPTPSGSPSKSANPERPFQGGTPSAQTAAKAQEMGLHGQAFVDAVPAQIRNNIEAVGNYEAPLTVFSKMGRAGLSQDRALALVRQFNPDYNPSWYTLQAQALKNFYASTAPNSPVVQARGYNTAVGHAGDLADAFHELHTADPGGFTGMLAAARQSNTPFISYLAAEAERRMAKGTVAGTPWAKIAAIAPLYAAETAKFYSGSAGSETERQQIQAPFNPNLSFPEVMAAMKAQAHMFKSKTDPLEQEFRDVMDAPGLKEYGTSKHHREWVATKEHAAQALQKIDTLAGGSATPKVGDRKQFKQGWGVWDGKQYVPEKP